MTSDRVSHTHHLGICYQVFKSETGELSVTSRNSWEHCDEETDEMVMAHALEHVVGCKESSLCPGCRGLAEHAFGEYCRREFPNASKEEEDGGAGE